MRAPYERLYIKLQKQRGCSAEKEDQSECLLGMRCNRSAENATTHVLHVYDMESLKINESDTLIRRAQI